MKQPIALLVTDTHLKIDNGDLVKSIIKQAIELCLSLGVKKIIHIGDWFDISSGKIVNGKFVNGQPEICFHNTIEMFSWFPENDIDFYIIPGNHEKSNRDSEKSYLDVFNIYPNITVLRNEKMNFNIGNIMFYSLPYFKESYVTRLKSIEVLNDYFNVLLSHKGIDGAVNNDGTKVQSDATENLFDKFDLGLFGDYHNRNSINEKLHYIGSPYQANYGEDNNKGFTILYDDGSYEFTRTKFPEYRKYTLNYQNLGEAEIKELLVEKQSGHNIRIELIGEAEKLKSFNRSFVTDLGIECVLKPSEALGSTNDNEAMQTVTYDKKSLSEAFISFCEENKVEDIEYGTKKMELI